MVTLTFDQPQSAQKFVEELSTCDEKRIIDISKTTEDWPLHKTEFSVWSPVIARFDSIIDRAVRQHGIKDFQSSPFSENTKQLLLAVLQMMTRIWENSHNRISYSSYQRTSELLCTSDIDVLEEVLRLALRPARRMRNQSIYKGYPVFLLSKIKVLASHWYVQETGVGIFQLFKNDEIPPRFRELNFCFYRDPKNSQKNSTSEGSETTNSQNLEKPVIIKFSEQELAKMSVNHVYSSSVAKYDIPEDMRYSFLWTIMVTKNIGNPEVRRKLISVKLLAMSLIFITVNTEVSRSDIFLYEPNFTQNIAEILGVDNPVYSGIKDFQNVQLSGITALNSLLYQKNRICEVLTNLNAWAFHGTLSCLFRSVVNSLGKCEKKYSQQFVNEVFNLVLVLRNSDIAGEPIVSGGYVQTLVKHMENPHFEHYRSISKAVIILDSFVSFFPYSLSAFTPTKGFEIVIQRIYNEVNWFIQYGTEILNEGRSGIPITEHIPAKRIILLRALLKFSSNLMQNSAFSDRARNLIDTTLPKSILLIFENSELFTPGIFLLAMNIVSTIVHNDPTSLTVLQELKITQTLVSQIAKSVPTSPDIMPHLITSLGTTCLNQAGLDYFKSSGVLRSIFKVFTTVEFLNLTEALDIANTVGDQMEEIIRHNPSLKTLACEEMIHLLKDVREIGQTPAADDPLNYRLHTPADYLNGVPKSTDKPTTFMRFIGVISKLFEGMFFDEPSQFDEVIDLGILNLVLDYYTAPLLPYNFTSVTSQPPLIYVFGIIGRDNMDYPVEEIKNRLCGIFDSINQNILIPEEFPISKCLNLSDESKIEKAQIIFKDIMNLAMYMSLLQISSSCFPTVYSNPFKFIYRLLSEENLGGKLDLLSDIYAMVIIERSKIINMLSKRQNPTDRVSLNTSKTSSGKVTTKSKEHQTGDSSKGNDPTSLVADKEKFTSLQEIFGLVPLFVLGIKEHTGKSTKDSDIPNEESSTGDHEYNNMIMFLHLLSRVYVLVNFFFGQALKTLTAKKFSEQKNRDEVHAIIERVANFYCNMLTHDRYKKEGSRVIKYQYLVAVICSLALILFDERCRTLLNLTSFGPIFREKRGVAILSDLVIELADRYHEIDVHDEEWGMINSALLVLLNLMCYLSNIEHVKTGKLWNYASASQNGGKQLVFNAALYMHEIANDISPALLRIWNIEFLSKATPMVQCVATKIVSNVLNNNNFKSSFNIRQIFLNAPIQQEPVASSYPVASDTTDIVADEDKAQQLMEMGFSRDSAEEALSRCNNDILAAAEYLINHRSRILGGTNDNNDIDGGGDMEMNDENDENHENDQNDENDENDQNDENDENDENRENEDTNSVNDISDPEVLGDVSDSSIKILDSKIEQENKRLEELKELRSKITAKLLYDPVGIVKEVVGLNPSLAFQMCQYLSLSKRDRIVEMVDSIVEELKPLVECSSMREDGTIFAYMRLLLLILHSPSSQNITLPSLDKFANSIINNLEKIADHIPIFLCPILLILDIYIRNRERSIGIGSERLGDGSNPSIFKLVNSYQGLAYKLAKILPKCLKKNLLNAVIIIIAYISSRPRILRNFTYTDFFKMIFSKEAIGLFPKQPELMAIIVRRLVEEDYTQRLAMLMEVYNKCYNWGQNKQGIKNFLAQVVYMNRNADTFLDLIFGVFNFPSHQNPAAYKQKIAISVKKEDDDDQGKEAENDQDPKKEFASLCNIALRADFIPPTRASQKSSNNIMQRTITMLLQEFAKCATTKSPSEMQSSETANNLQNDSNADYTEDLLYIKRCYILQILTELVVSYPHASVCLLPRHRTHEYENLIPDTISKMMFSNTPTSLQSANLKCDFNSTPEQKKNYEANISKFLLLCMIHTAERWKILSGNVPQVLVTNDMLELVMDTFKRITSNGEYSKSLHSIYLFMCDFVYRIIGDPVFGCGKTSLSDMFPTPRTLIQLIDKGYVQCIVQIIADLDIYNPQSKPVILMALKSLAIFSKVAIDLGDPLDDDGSNMDFYNLMESSDAERVISEEAEISDVYKNSSLRIYGDSQSDEEDDDDLTNEMEGVEEYFQNSSSQENENDEEEGSVEYSDTNMDMILPQVEDDDTSGGSDEMDDVEYTSEGEEYEEDDSASDENILDIQQQVSGEGANQTVWDNSESDADLEQQQSRTGYSREGINWTNDNASNASRHNYITRSRDFEDITHLSLRPGPSNEPDNLPHVGVEYEIMVNNDRLLHSFLDIRRTLPRGTNVSALQGSIIPQTYRTRDYPRNNLMEMNMDSEMNFGFNFLPDVPEGNDIEMFGNLIPVRQMFFSTSSAEEFVHPLVRVQRQSRSRGNSEHMRNGIDSLYTLFELNKNQYEPDNCFGFPLWRNMLCSCYEDADKFFTENMDKPIRCDPISEKDNNNFAEFTLEDVKIKDRYENMLSNEVQCTADRWLEETIFRYGEGVTGIMAQLEESLIDFLVKKASGEGASKDQIQIKRERKRIRSSDSATVHPGLPENSSIQSTSASSTNISDSRVVPEFINILPRDLRQEVFSNYSGDQEQTNEVPDSGREHGHNETNLNLDAGIGSGFRQNDTNNVQRESYASVAAHLDNALPQDNNEANASGNADSNNPDRGFPQNIRVQRVRINREPDYPIIDPCQEEYPGSDDMIHSTERHDRNFRVSDYRRTSIRQGIDSAFRDLDFFNLSIDERSECAKNILNRAKNSHLHKEAIPLFDKSFTSTILRLLFFTEPLGKLDLHTILSNSCENSTFCREVFQTLIYVLHEEINDIHAVDKILRDTAGKNSQEVRHPTGNVPNLIPKRCLEALVMLLSSEKNAKYLLMENEGFVTSISKIPKRFRPKDRSHASISKRPIVLLFQLIEKPMFSQNSVLIELVVIIIVNILQPLAIFKQKKDKESLALKNEQDKDKIPNEESESNNSGRNKPKEELGTNSGESSTREGKNKSHKIEMKKFEIPDSYIYSIVKILTNSVCPRKTFQYTVSLLHILSLICDNKDDIIKVLMGFVQNISHALIPQLRTLMVELERCDDSYIGGNVFSKFSSPSSKQAKLLRILKAVDYIHYKNACKTSQDKDYNDPRVTDSNVERELISSYNKLNLKDLWDSFSGLLTTISSSETLISTAAVLLPMIESFMVIMRPYVMGISGTEISDEMDNRDLFFKFTEEHKKILNIMIRQNPSLMNGSFSLLIQNTKILEFDNKRNYFYQQLQKSASENSGTLQINVRRKYIFEDSYHQLRGYTGEEIKNSVLCVRFYGEEGVDAGGLSREWFSALARQMFNPNYALFRPSAKDKVTYQPNRLSYVNSDHLFYFKFVGTIIGKAIYDKHLLDAYFTRSFYKAIIGLPIDIKDMEAVDPEFHKSLEWILHNDITDILDLTFCTEIDEFGKKRILELIPNGNSIPVTERNKHQYVKLIVEQHLAVTIKTQVNSFMEGFYEIINSDLVKIFNEQELELLISGLPDIDIDEWKNNTDYQNYTSTSPQIQWFWRAVRSFSQEERAKLLQFCTGTSKVPLEGLQGFQIHKDFSSANRLPSAHTCFNQLDLPAYESYEILRKNLLLAICEGGVGFGFA